MPATDRTADDSATVEELQALLGNVPGIAELVVDLRDDAVPRLRLKLDGSISEDEVGAEVRRRLATRRAGDGARKRRSGLGRGLPDIIAAESSATPPAQLEVAEPIIRPGLVLVAVEETAGGVSVRAADSIGGVAFSPVEDTRSLNQAVVSAVGRLRRVRPLPRLVGVEVRDVNGAAVLTVVLTLSDGRRAVGAALVDAGMPFTLGRAVWEALDTVD